MKSYKRLTERITASNTGRTVLVIPTFRHEIIEQTNRLAELEDKIESGELCDREEVKRETAREILEWLKFLYAERQKEYTNWDGNKINAVTTEWLNADIECIAEEYGIELFGKTEQVGNSDKLEDGE